MGSGSRFGRTRTDMDIILANRTAETAAIYFEKINNETIRKLLPQKAKTVEEAVADFHASQRPDATSYGRNMVSYCVFEQTLWGQGIASKALAMFLLEITWKYGLKAVGAFTFSHNLSSIRVLEKNGFRLMDEFFEDGIPSRYYQLNLEQGKA